MVPELEIPKSEASLPKKCYLNPLGPAVVLKRIHTGALFEVFRVRVGDQEYAVKSPRPQRPPTPSPWVPQEFVPKAFDAVHPSVRDWELSAAAGCWSKSVFMFGVTDDPLGFTRPATCTPAEWSWLGFALLGAEAEHVRSTQGRWNHEVVAFGMWDEGDWSHLSSGRATPARGWNERLRPALVMPWYEGTNLGALSPDEQRALFPCMLPALWDALLVARHGDLSPSNLRLLSDRRRFVLLDPGIQLRSSDSTGGNCMVDDLDMFITNTGTYPVLHPYLASVMPSSPPSAEFWAPRTPADRHELAALISWRSPEYMRGHFLMSRDAQIEACPRLGPPPADWLAAGIMYFVMLTGAHPFYRKGFDAPAWCGARTSILTWAPHPRSLANDPDFPRWAERCRDLLASTRGLKDAERKLAIDLLSLSYTTREQLLAALMPLVET